MCREKNICQLRASKFRALFGRQLDKRAQIAFVQTMVEGKIDSDLGVIYEALPRSVQRIQNYAVAINTFDAPIKAVVCSTRSPRLTRLVSMLHLGVAASRLDYNEAPSP